MLIPTAHAQFAAGPTYSDIASMDLVGMIYLLVALAILAAGALSIAYIFWGGFTFILSGGDEGKVKEAIHTIRYAIIGLVVTIMSFLVVPVIGRLLGFDFQFFDLPTVMSRAQLLIQDFRGGAGVNTAPDFIPQNNSVSPSSIRTTPDIQINDLIN